VYLRIYQRWSKLPNAPQPWNVRPIDKKYNFSNTKNNPIDFTKDIPIKKESNTLQTAIKL
jgi:hypothetical protein